MIQKILNGYKLPEIPEKYLGKKETGLFLDLAAYSLISENNAAQYYPFLCLRFVIYKPKEAYTGLPF